MLIKATKSSINRILNAAGYEIKKRSQNSDRSYWPEQLPMAQTFYELDERFHNLYDHAQVRTQMTQTDNPLRRQRHYTLNYLLWCADIEKGDVCEMGCWRGLSTYQIASHIKKIIRMLYFMFSILLKDYLKLSQLMHPLIEFEMMKS